MRRDREWAVIAVLLGAPSIAARTQPFVELSTRQVDWSALRSAAMQWGPRDRVLIDVAYDLTAGSGADEAVDGLSDRSGSH